MTTTAATAAAVLAFSGLVVAPAQAARTDTVLTTGERLAEGDSLVSPNGRYRLEVTGGVLRLSERPNAYASPRPYFEEYGVGAVVLQADGDLVVLDPDGTPKYGFDTAGTGAAAVRVQNDRNVVFFDGSGRVVADLSTYNQHYVEAGDALLPGDQVAGRGGTRLLMQPDGNLVHYRGATALWSSRTAGRPGAAAVMQEDGNLVVYSSVATGRTPLFNTGTASRRDLIDPYLSVEDTEVSVTHYDETDLSVAVWGSNWSKDRVAPGDELHPGDRRISRDGRCTLVMQSDGNLVDYCDGRAVWSTGVIPRGDDFAYGTAVMQTDGNFVVYRTVFGETGPRYTRAHFHTGTGTPRSSLFVQGDRNVVVVAPTGRPVWSRLTGPL